MAKRSRKRSQNQFDLYQGWLELRENFSQEALGLALFALGGYLGLTLIVSEGGVWLSDMVGWAGWPVVLLLLLTGAVLMMGERSGYWNPEAIVGAEILLISLLVLGFIQRNESADWMPSAAASNGLVGWGLGNLLLDLLGRWPALALALAGILFGAYLLIRHTPLIFLLSFISYTGGVSTEDSQIPQPPVRPVDPGPSRPEVETADADVSTPPDSGPKRQRPRKNPPKAKATNKLVPVRSGDELPPRELLATVPVREGSRDTHQLESIIVQTLEDFNVPVRVVDHKSGPTVTQFAIQPLYVERAGKRRKVRVSRIVSLADDLALALAAPSVRIEAPVPGQPYVGIEVPNRDKDTVGLRGIIESSEMEARGGILPLSLGRDTAGAPIVSDLSRAPHLLIAGATGAGKSVCINSIIVNLLMHHGPESLRMVMVDPKMVELPGYNGIPHLIGKVVTEMDQVHGALTWLLLQMDDRYQLFREQKVRNIDAYNQKARKKKDMTVLPYIVLVVDELADLMMTAPEEIEKQLVRLAQMARATGIHMILATQRPSTDVVTGLIKANFPTRIAFAVTSQIDSRVILDSPGAEKLLGQGDMLLMRPENAKLQRVQGCWVSDKEIERIVKYWQEKDRQENPDAPRVRVAPWIGLLDKEDDEEELIYDAIDAIRGQESCSTSFVQRKLRIGYPRAARLMQELESRGVVGPDQGGGKGRPVLLKDGEEDAEHEDEEEMF